MATKVQPIPVKNTKIKSQNKNKPQTKLKSTSSSNSSIKKTTPPSKSKPVKIKKDVSITLPNSPSSSSIKSVAISKDARYIKYDDPIFGQLRQNQNSINPCTCLSCHGRCFLYTWCKVIASIEIVISTTGIIIAISMLSLEEDTKINITHSLAHSLSLYPSTFNALDTTFIICLVTYLLMLLSSIALLVAAVAIGRDEQQKALLYYSRGWMNITFIKTCCWAYPVASLLCTFIQLWSFLLSLHEGFIITFGFLPQLYFSICSIGLYTQIRISSFDRVKVISTSPSQLKSALKTRSKTYL